MMWTGGLTDNQVDSWFDSRRQMESDRTKRSPPRRQRKQTNPKKIAQLDEIVDKADGLDETGAGGSVLVLQPTPPPPIPTAAGSAASESEGVVEYVQHDEPTDDADAAAGGPTAFARENTPQADASRGSSDLLVSGRATTGSTTSPPTLTSILPIRSQSDSSDTT